MLVIFTKYHYNSKTETKLLDFLEIGADQATAQRLHSNLNEFNIKA